MNLLDIEAKPAAERTPEEQEFYINELVNLRVAAALAKFEHAEMIEKARADVLRAQAEADKAAAERKKAEEALTLVRIVDEVEAIDVKK